MNLYTAIKQQVEKRLNQVLQSNRYVNIEVDRVSQNYILSNKEFVRVQEFAGTIRKEQEASSILQQGDGKSSSALLQC